MKLTTGEVVELHDGLNVYKVTESCEKHAYLECVYFVSSEDLGDGITCDSLGQKTWVAQFFAGKFMPSTFV